MPAATQRYGELRQKRPPEENMDANWRQHEAFSAALRDVSQPRAARCAGTDYRIAARKRFTGMSTGRVVVETSKCAPMK